MEFFNLIETSVMDSKSVLDLSNNGSERNLKCRSARECRTDQVIMKLLIRSSFSWEFEPGES